MFIICALIVMMDGWMDGGMEGGKDGDILHLIDDKAVTAIQSLGSKEFKEYLS